MLKTVTEELVSTVKNFYTKSETKKEDKRKEKSEIGILTLF